MMSGFPTSRTGSLQGLRKAWRGYPAALPAGQDGRGLMKLTADRPFANPEKAARKLVEIANSIEAVQDGRIYIELVNASTNQSRPLQHPFQKRTRSRAKRS